MFRDWPGSSGLNCCHHWPDEAPPCICVWRQLLRTSSLGYFIMSILCKARRPKAPIPTFMSSVPAEGGGWQRRSSCLPSNFFPAKQSMMAQQQLSYNHLVLFRYALMPSTSRQSWAGGWGSGNWINLSHRGKMAPESFGYSINHLSFTCSLPLLCLIIYLSSFPSHVHVNAFWKDSCLNRYNIKSLELFNPHITEFCFVAVSQTLTVMTLLCGVQQSD